MENKPYKAKKSLGQNFLKSEKALNLMISAGSIDNNDIVIEIGAGKGVLTEKLLEKAKKVVAIEKDRDLIEILEEKFQKETGDGKLEIINDDCLEFDPNKTKSFSGKYKIVANIPYYITGAIIRKFLESENQPETMVLLIQKEVAERIVTRDNKESLLSLSVKAYGTPKYIDKVSKRYFTPSPKVDSAIIAINSINRDRFDSPELESKFFELIHAGFAHKRKMLISNLSLKFKKDELQKIFNDLYISEKSRAEDIPIEKWIEISKLIY